MATTLPQLPAEVAAKYRCPIVPCRIEIQRLGRTIDLTTLSLAEADELVKDPLFTYLIPRRTRRTSAKQLSKPAK